MAEYEAYKDSGFEWLGNIPVSWPIVLLSQIVTQVKNKNSDLREQNLLSLSYGRIKRKPIDTNGGLLPESFDGYNVIESNDIVLRLTDLQNDHRSLRVGLATERGIITSAYTTMRPRNSESAKYLYYLLHTFDIRKGFYGMGSGVRQGLNYDEVKKLKLPLPTLVEQESIATYLDRETERIEAIIAEVKASIEEYKAWKASIIYEAVTKGLNPNVELMDSGFEWLGKIPVSWTMVLLSQVVAQVKHKNSELKEQNLLSLSYGRIKRKPIDTSGGLLPESFDGYNIIEANDIVLRLTDLQNDHKSLRVGLATERGIITSAYTTMRPRNPESAKYLYYLLHTFDVCKGFYGMGSGVRQGLNYDEVKKLKLPMPTLTEQIEIGRMLDTKSSQIDSLIAEKEALVKELEAYKKSIVFETVTGKRKVV